jgi:hypothetical protein
MSGFSGEWGAGIAAFYNQGYQSNIKEWHIST